MIYTCTLNPSLDYYMEFDKVELGKTNRSSLEYYEAGGKGINVSIVLNNLMIPSRALGFVGGFTKDFFISLLQKYEYIEPVFTFIEGHTRINVKVKGDLLETELNEAGFTSITTIFSLNPKGEKAPCFAVPAPVSLVSRQDRPFAKSVAEGWVIQKGADQFTVMIAHEDYMGPSDAVLVNERQGMGHVIVWSGLDKEQWGTTLAY